MQDPEQRFERKIFKIGRSAAYALGGAIGCWFLSLVYPHPENAQHITNVLGGLAWLLLGYGAFMFAVILFKKRLAPLMNLLFIGFVIPSGVLYIFVNNWPH